MASDHAGSAAGHLEWFVFHRGGLLLHFCAHTGVGIVTQIYSESLLAYSDYLVVLAV